MTSGEALDSVAESESTPAKKRHKNVLRRRPRFRASIQSKLMVLLLLTSIVSVAAIAAIVYQSGRTSLRAAAYERLTQLRESQKRAVETLFSDLTNSLVIYERGLTVVDAVVRFTAGFDQLADATISPAQQQAIVNYYNNEFITPVERTTGDKLDITALLPTSPAQRYLQAYYTAPFTSDQDAMRLDDAGDGSAWSAANAQFNSYFREIVTRFDYDDAVLLDTRGNIVYTLSKDPDLGTNILTGPYRESICVTPTLKRWAPTPSTLPGLPTSSRISLNSACRPRGWWHRSKRAAKLRAFWRCRCRSTRSIRS